MPIRVSNSYGVCGLLGHPVHRSLSPRLFNAAFVALGLPWQYAAFDIPPSSLKAAVRALRTLGLRGCNVTRPHKERIIRYLDEADDMVSHVGAANTVAMENGIWRGYNTDVQGVEQPLREAGNPVSGGEALLLGAGGAARAAVLALARLGCRMVRVSNRHPARSRHLARLAAQLGLEVTVLPWTRRGLTSILRGVQVVLNATPCGSAEIPALPPLPFAHLSGEHWVFDMVYRPGGGGVTRAAQQYHARVISGEQMLLAQAVASFEYFTRRAAPRDVMARALAEALGAGR